MEGIFYHVVSGDHGCLGGGRWIGLNNSKILVKSKGPVLMLQARACMSMLERAAEEETQFYCQPRA